MIAVFLANGFEEIEALATVDILRRAELKVVTVGVGAQVITGSHGIPVTCDTTVDVLPTEGLQMVVLPGGLPGTLNLEASQQVQAFIDLAVNNGAYVAAICAAPSILGHKGLLDGRSFTCYPGYETQAPNGRYTAGRVEVDGQFITACGAGAAEEFGLKLAELLCGAERSHKVAASMQCR